MEGNFFACCSALEEFTNFRVAAGSNNKIASRLSNKECMEKEYSGIVTCKVNAFHLFRDL